MSPQFFFDSGEVLVWTPGQAHEDSAIATALVQSNILELRSVSCGPLVLVFRHGVVRSRVGDQTRSFSGMALRTEISATDVARDTVELCLGVHVFARLAVAPSGSADAPSIGVALDDVTLEVTSNVEGYVDVLLPPGQYLTYTVQEPMIKKWISIPQGATDAGVFQLDA